MVKPEREMPGLVVSYTSTIENAVRPFIKATTDAGLDVAVEVREGGAAYMALEWYIPTAVVVLLAKPYLDGLLKEAAKDHYLLLKKNLPLLWGKFFGKERTVAITVVADPPGKAELVPTYSRGVSIMARLDGTIVKLLLPDDATPPDLDAAAEGFFELVNHYPNDNVGLRATKASSGYVFLAYDPETKCFTVLDPRAKKSG